MAANSSEGMVRYNLDVSTDMDRTLDEMAFQIGGTKSDLFRKAVALMMFAVKAKQQGQIVGILDKDNNLVSRIVGL
ncbi:MAG TPA: hypothetical protein VK447_10070 [Myxococcaceae bacterium]|nr:hypothetical protein [Myxococcaceae bacterium]